MLVELKKSCGIVFDDSGRFILDKKTAGLCLAEDLVGLLRLLILRDFDCMLRLGLCENEVMVALGISVAVSRVSSLASGCT